MHKERSRRPNHQTEDMIRRMPLIAGKKTETYRNQVFINGHAKEELQIWDARMREGLGYHEEYQQSRPLRELIHSGRLKIKQSAKVATRVKQDPENHLAANIVKEREQKQRTARRNPMQGERQAHPSSSSSQCDGLWTSSWWESWKWTAR